MASRHWPIFAVLVLQVACGCVYGNAEADSPPSDAAAPVAASPSAPRGAEVAIKWQDHMLAELNRSTGMTEAWGVFSEGGWSNAGQVMVLFNADRTTRRLLIVPSNKAAVSVDRSLTDSELSALADACKDAESLADVDIPSFDGLIFEIVHVVRDADGKASVKKRILLRNPGAKPTPAHDAVVAAFQALKKP